MLSASTVGGTEHWYKIEIHLNASTGAWEIKIDGTTELSGTDTFAAGNVTAIVWGKRDNRNSQTMDIVWANAKYDTAGYPGDSNVAVLKADGNGTYTAWTGDYTPEWTEAPPITIDDADASQYVATSDDPNVESATMESCTTGGISGTINAVKSIAIVRQTATLVAVITRLRSGTTDDDTSGVGAGTAYLARGKLYLLDPADSGSWTTTKVDALEVGIKHNQAQTREARCTAVFLVVDYTPASGAHPLTATGTTFNYTGQDVGLLWKQLLPATGATFNYTGQDVTLKHGYPLVATGTSFNYTGQDATLLWKQALNAVGATFNYTGQDATLKQGYKVAADGASYNYAGQDVTLLWKHFLAALGAAFDYIGQDVTLTYTPVGQPRTLTADGATFDYTGQDAALLWKQLLNAAGATFDYTGQDVGLLWKRVLGSQGATFNYIGEDITLIYTPLNAFVLTANGALFNYTGSSINLVWSAAPVTAEGILRALLALTDITRIT